MTVERLSIAELLDTLEAWPVDGRGYLQNVPPEYRQRIYDLATHQLVAINVLGSLNKNKITAWIADLRPRIPELVAKEVTANLTK